MKNRGKLIVIEASNDRLGKTTLTNALIEALKELGEEVVFYHFHDRNVLTGQYIDKLLQPDSPIDIKTLDPEFVANLYLLDMAMKNKQIEDDLNAGKYVILDRYYMSTIIYESTMAALEGWSVEDFAIGIEKLAKQKYHLHTPDEVICLYANQILETFYNSVEGEGDNFENRDFQSSLLNTFLTLKDNTEIFKGYRMYNRGTDGNILEYTDILKDILTYI